MKKHVLAAVLALGVGAAALQVWRRLDPGPTAVGWNGGDIYAPGAADVVVAAPVTGAGVRREGLRPADEPPPDEVPADEPPIGRGTVHGWAFDVDHSPLARWRLTFAPAGEALPGAREVTLWTSALGYYETGPMAAGTWRGYHSPEDPTVPRPTTSSMGTVEVRAGQSERFDFVLTGRRTLTGIVTCTDPGMDGISLRLELRRRWLPEEVVAGGETVTWEHPPWSNDGPPAGASGEVEGEPPGPVVGKFSFVGLDADEYFLRVFLNDDGFHLDVPVDLRESSVELDPMRLTLTDFFDAKLARER